LLSRTSCSIFLAVPRICTARMPPPVFSDMLYNVALFMQVYIVLLPVLLTASLLLPTLHLHLVHDHDGHSHQHAIIHADFLSVSAQDHRHARQEAAVLGADSPWAFTQSGLIALFARNVESQLTSLEKTPDFFLIDVAITHPQLVQFVHILKRDHPPPMQQVFLAPNAPRSPPQLV